MVESITLPIDVALFKNEEPHTQQEAHKEPPRIVGAVRTW